MAVANSATHFIQRCEGPVFIGSGSERLVCACGQILIDGYDPDRFLAVGIACGQCGSVTTTPGLADGAAPPFAVVIAEPASELRTTTTELPKSAYIVGRAEMDRIAALYAPRTPKGNFYTIDAAMVDAVEADAGVLPTVTTAIEGLKEHALAWAIGYARQELKKGPWPCLADHPSSMASALLAAFRHFVLTWSHHPLFPAMMATAAERGHSLHGLAPFAAAHCLSMQGNRVGFPKPTGYPGLIEHCLISTGPVETVTVYTDVFDRFEYPFGQSWDGKTLRAAVQTILEGSVGRINPRHPGMLLLSPGFALAGFDETLIQATQAAMAATGRRLRGLMAAGPIQLRVLPGGRPDTIQFGYGFFPVQNRHFRKA